MQIQAGRSTHHILFEESHHSTSQCVGIWEVEGWRPARLSQDRPWRVRSCTSLAGGLDLSTETQESSRNPCSWGICTKVYPQKDYGGPFEIQIIPVDITPDEVEWIASRTVCLGTGTTQSKTEVAGGGMFPDFIHVLCHGNLFMPRVSTAKRRWQVSSMAPFFHVKCKDYTTSSAPEPSSRIGPGSGGCPDALRPS